MQTRKSKGGMKGGAFLSFFTPDPAIDINQIIPAANRTLEFFKNPPTPRGQPHLKEIVSQFKTEIQKSPEQVVSEKSAKSMQPVLPVQQVPASVPSTEQRTNATRTTMARMNQMSNVRPTNVRPTNVIQTEMRRINSAPLIRTGGRKLKGLKTKKRR